MLFSRLYAYQQSIPKTKTDILLNIGNPNDGFRLSNLPVAGVGLARLEFIVANLVQVHPLALLQFDLLQDEKAKLRIQELTVEYPDKPQYFVDVLASGIAQIAAAFYPKPVIVRMSDFKT